MNITLENIFKVIGTVVAEAWTALVTFPLDSLPLLVYAALGALVLGLWSLRTN